MEMLILVLVVAAIAAYFLWGRRGDSDAALVAAASAADGPLASVEAYRQRSPSNFYLGKPTCNRCGSTLVDTSGSVTSCRNCGTALYRN